MPHPLNSQFIMPEIIKADGTKETFDPTRLHKSLLHAGAGEHIAREVAENISQTVHHGMH